jgi:hypothetical protein
VNFYIYFIKHYHTILKRRQRSDDNSRVVTIATTTRLGKMTADSASFTAAKNAQLSLREILQRVQIERIFAF